MTASPHPDTPENRNIHSILQATWQKNKPLFQERITLVEFAGRSALTGDLAPALLAELQSTAHKLAGSLGMFGFPEGTALARELETGLIDQTISPERIIAVATELRHMLFPPGEAEPESIA